MNFSTPQMPRRCLPPYHPIRSFHRRRVIIDRHQVEKKKLLQRNTCLFFPPIFTISPSTFFYCNLPCGGRYLDARNRILRGPALYLLDPSGHFRGCLGPSEPNHTSYLSFPLHGQDFQIPNFTPKIPKIYPKKSKVCSFSCSIWKILHLTE